MPANLQAGSDQAALLAAQDQAGSTAREDTAFVDSAPEGEGALRAAMLSHAEAEQKRARPNRKPQMQVWKKPGAAVGTRRGREVYAAIDLGTNNCRLLVARRAREGFRVVDAYSRIVRLGEGVRGSGSLSEEAMARAVEALEACAEKMSRRGVTRSWSIATEACRLADNGDEFRKMVRDRTGLELDIISTEREARLALQGCVPLLESKAKNALVFDIGGGSTELVWVDCTGDEPKAIDWISIPSGVVTLTEALHGREPTEADYTHMMDVVRHQLKDFAAKHGHAGQGPKADVQLLGTSGTVTTLAGIHLKLPRYDRRVVDGTWIASDALLRISRRLAALDYAGRVAEPCIGEERADLVVAGCAIMEAIMTEWPSTRVRVADRGLREGMLLHLMEEAQNERRVHRGNRRSAAKATEKNAGTTPATAETKGQQRAPETKVQNSPEDEAEKGSAKNKDTKGQDPKSKIKGRGRGRRRRRGRSGRSGGAAETKTTVNVND